MEEITWNRIDEIIKKLAIDIWYHQPRDKRREENIITYNEMLDKVKCFERKDETALHAGKIVAEAILRIQINEQN